MFRIIPRSNWWAASLMLAIGLIGAHEATSYPFTMDRIIGPAVFPLGLSLLLSVCALGILVEGALVGRRGEAAIAPRWRALICVVGGLLAFAFLVERAGMVPAVTACVVLSSLADREATPLRTLAVALAMSVGCTLVFYHFLRLPLPPFAW